MENTLVIDNERELQHIRELFEYSSSKQLISGQFGSGKANPDIQSLMQPKSVTYSLLPSRQGIMDVLAETVRCLQPYMTRDPQNCLSGRNVGIFFVPIDFEKIAGFHRNRKEIEAFIAELKKLSFGFSWVQAGFVDADGRKVREKKFDYSGSLFIGHIKEENDGYVYNLHINPMALPYLTFVGRGMGYTKFDYSDLQLLDSGYEKKLYQILCDWASQGQERSVLIKELRHQLSYPEGDHDCHFIKRHVEKLRNVLVSAGSGFQFDYDLILSEEGRKVRKAGRKGYDTLFFKFNAPGKKAVCISSNKVNALKDCLKAIADREKHGVIDDLVARIMEKDKLDFILGKCRYYYHRQKNGFIDEAKMKNTLLKIVRESFGYDLRSSEHVRNVAVNAVRKANTFSQK